MKRKINCKFVIIAGIIGFALLFTLWHGYVGSGERPAKPYDFQLPEGTTDIGQYQIPEQELEGLSTESLVETILDNGFLMQFEAYDSSKIALNMHMTNFNVYPALFSREDCVSVLLKLYEQEPVVSDTKSADQQPEEYFRMHNLEILLAAKFAEDQQQGNDTAQEMKEFERIHQEKENQREAVGTEQTVSDGYEWFEENYY